MFSHWQAFCDDVKLHRALQKCEKHLDVVNAQAAHNMHDRPCSTDKQEEEATLWDYSKTGSAAHKLAPNLTAHLISEAIAIFNMYGLILNSASLVSSYIVL